MKEKYNFNCNITLRTPMFFLNIGVEFQTRQLPLNCYNDVLLPHHRIFIENIFSIISENFITLDFYRAGY